MKKTEHAEIKLVIDGIAFTWDDKKAAANLRKHGVRFSEAAAIFRDENIVIDLNSIDDYTGEERLQAVGMIYGDVMFMVYVERVTMDNDDIIRIISARHATREEERYYAYGLA